MRVDNCAFASGPSGDVTNATGDGTAYAIGAGGVTNDYDLALAVSATGVFTAPLHGYYEFTAQAALGALGAGHTEAQLTLACTGQTYLLQNINAAAARTAAGVGIGNELIMRGTVRVLMAAGDTAVPKITIYNSTKTVSVLSGVTGTNWRTRFEGRMV